MSEPQQSPSDLQEHAAHRSEERYRAFVETSSEGIWCFEMEQPISMDASEEELITHFYRYASVSECNTVIAQMYGFDRAQQLIGARLTDLLPPTDPDNIASLRAFIRSGYRLMNAESQKIDNDGNLHYFSSTLVGIADGRLLRGAWATQRDITEQKRTHVMLRQQAQELSLLYEAGFLLGATLDPERIYDTLRAMIARMMDCDGLMVSLYTESDQLIRCAYAWIEGSKVDVSAFPPLTLAPVGKGMQSSVIRTGESILINDYAAHTNKSVISFYANSDGTVKEAPDPGKAIVNALMLVPIKLDAQVLGVAQVQSLRHNAYTADHLRLLESLLIQMAAAIRNAFLFHEVQTVAEQQRRFLRDALASMTEGKLRLCFSVDDLPVPLPVTFGPSSLSGANGFYDLRQAAMQAAETAGFVKERWWDLLIAASEAAMNAVVHAGGGEARVGSDGQAVVQVWITDQGQGISVERLPRATLEKGYTTAGTLGHGMKMMLATADRVWLLTGPSGTTVVLEQDRIAPPEDLF